MPERQNRRIILLPDNWIPQGTRELEAAVASLVEAIGGALRRGFLDETFVYFATNAESVARVWPGASVWGLRTLDAGWTIVLEGTVFYSWQAALEQQIRIWREQKPVSRGLRLQS